MSNKGWYVYTLYSKEFDRIYIGMSEDPVKRLAEHNSGKTTSTKPYRPWIKIYEEFVGEIKAARKREKQLKSGSGREFIKDLIENSLDA